MFLQPKNVRQLKSKLTTEELQKRQEIQNKEKEKMKHFLKYKNLYSPVLFNKLTSIHRNLRLDFGTFLDEYPEQIMAVRYLKGQEKVLEIGGNIGRNSLVIASILNQANNGDGLVSLETDNDFAQKLCHNRDINNLHFLVENSAL